MRRREFLRLLIIACLVAALLQGPISLLRVINPSRVWILLPLVGFIVALEAALTTRWFVGSAPRINRAAYRAAELLILLIAARLITWVWSGDLPGVADIRPYLVQPASVIDFTFVIYAALIFFAWERSISFTGIFADLAITPAEKQYFSSNPLRHTYRDNCAEESRPAYAGLFTAVDYRRIGSRLLRHHNNFQALRAASARGVESAKPHPARPPP